LVPHMTKACVCLPPILVFVCPTQGPSRFVSGPFLEQFVRSRSHFERDEGRAQARVGFSRRDGCSGLPHSGFRTNFRHILGRKSVTLSVETPLCPYGIVYRGAYGLSTSESFNNGFVDLLSSLLLSSLGLSDATVYEP